jgi:hypothetical protein
MIALSIVLLLLAIAGLQAAIWIPLIIWFRRRTRRWEASFRDELAASGEALRRGPEPANYEGASFGYTQVKGSGVIVLTDQRLLFRKLTGGRIDLPLSEVAGLREVNSFLNSYRIGRRFLILRLKNHDEVGFIVRDQPAWMSAVQEACDSDS